MNMQTINPARVDVNGGYICLWSHWKPDPALPDPEMPGTKEDLLTYMPQSLEELCMCGSGKAYGECCKQEQYWWPLCPDPELEGYSLFAPQALTFRKINGAILRERLMENDRLNCTEDSEKQGTWSYWGDTFLETPGYGTVEFGELEIRHNHTLLLTVSSDARRQVLLAFLKEIAGDLLGNPEHKYLSIQVYDKHTGKNRTLPPLQWLNRPVGIPG